jgi:hypothetical protein
VITNHWNQWFGRGGVVLVLYSLILTHNPARIFDDMKLASDATLVVGDKGYCRQELVNLMLFGRATPNLHDGTNEMLNGVYGPGVPSRCMVGFLPPPSARSMTGTFLKRPTYPIWVVLGGQHYTTIWSGDHGLTESKDGTLTTSDGKKATTSSGVLYHFNGLGLLHWQNETGTAQRGARTTRIQLAPFDWKQLGKVCVGISNFVFGGFNLVTGIAAAC